jgi:hypothetical protein
MGNYRYSQYFNRLSGKKSSSSRNEEGGTEKAH